MSVDLGTSLAELARSVHDDGAAERMAGQVRPMVGRIRRRRAARRAGQGAVGLGAAAAVVVGAVQVADRPGTGTAPPAGPSVPVASAPVPSASSDAGSPEAAEAARAAAVLAALVTRASDAPFPQCGSAVPAPADAPLTLGLALPTTTFAPGDRVEQTASLGTGGGSTVLATVETGGARLVVARDGVVVGGAVASASDGELLEVGPAGMPVPAAGTLALCPEAGTSSLPLDLPAGSYEVYAVLDVALKEVTGADGTAVSASDVLTVTSTPVTVTVG